MNIHQAQEPVTIADRLFLDLRLAILEGELPAGGKISEPELSSAYGVSRGSLREAIAKLERCNLVTRKPNIGARIVSFSVDQLMEIYQVREAMEGMAARLAAEHMSIKDLAHLASLLDRQKEAITEAERLQQSHMRHNSDLDFHFCIIQASGNERLIQMLCQDLYDLVWFYRLRLNPAYMPKALQEHELIVEAMQRRDGEMAELLMRHHIRASRERSRLQLETMAQVDMGNPGKKH